ncbi:transposase [Methylorubrum populi]|uniref:zinc ribbon domain-containing protein n=1 Tax=Methylorubrum rhodesianum TaxID=29427 RepID=UPI0019095AC5|nr:transposase [Methylorubrum rhodesianum]MBY0144020.1 transposase [Methylorubrum populi]
MRQKAGLNRAILNAGWHAFATILSYKLEERGGRVVPVPARSTSQTCGACGVGEARSRESQARFVCMACGHLPYADRNAAINIRRRWSTPLRDVEGLRQLPCEASAGRVSRSAKSPGLQAGKDVAGPLFVQRRLGGTNMRPPSAGAAAHAVRPPPSMICRRFAETCPCNVSEWKEISPD